MIKRLHELLCFNSIVVRLKEQSLWLPCKWDKTSFNSIVVRLKVRQTFEMEHGRKGFNSIVVRLKVRDTMRDGKLLWQFQFHSGSIKRELQAAARMQDEKRFNSIVVRLKESVRHCFDDPITCFNSIVVRLKESQGRGGRACRSLFQFHSGSIKRRPGGVRVGIL